MEVISSYLELLPLLLPWVVIFLWLWWSKKHNDALKAVIDSKEAVIEAKNAQIDALRDRAIPRMFEDLQKQREYYEQTIREMEAQIAQLQGSTNERATLQGVDGIGTVRVSATIIDLSILALSYKTLSDLLVMHHLYQIIHPSLSPESGAPQPAELFTRIFASKGKLDSSQDGVSQLRRRLSETKGELKDFEEPSVLRNVGTVARELNDVYSEAMVQYRKYLGPVVEQANIMVSRP